jgi:hypothetical protein
MAGINTFALSSSLPNARTNESTLGGPNINQLLSLKYALAQQSADADTQRAKAAALESSANVGLTNAKTALLPDESASEIALRAAQGQHFNALTRSTNVGTDLAPATTASGIDLQGAQAFSARANGENDQATAQINLSDAFDDTLGTSKSRLKARALGIDPVLSTPAVRPANPYAFGRFSLR